ncbi:uncharacterized protein IL334_004910 [Kwoniella shivajii]|uniref:Polynucleotide 5'-hydroxyl-kinase GRC3 n=1 Tax=Kwoniella shivajii TaxID=564305 RepID=A0ABZ1D238_9TREE|nr:hypothetical protein IL334_004910 [Kwoniella shivajii]
MSALAARRAAALAASSSAPSPSSSTPLKGRSPSPAADIEESEGEGSSESESEGESSTPPPPMSTSNKKRKIRRSPSGNIPTPPQRYYNASTEQPRITIPPTQANNTTVNQNRKRRFSPAVPAEISNEYPSDSDDSSVGDSDADIAEEEGSGEDEEAINEVDEGRIKWALPMSTDSTPGPSRRTKTKPAVLDSISNTSNFNPIEGINLYKMSEDELSASGLQDEYSGDGLILSLAKDETLIIAGTYILTPLSRSITISSCVLSSDESSHQIFAPTSHPIPIIAPSPATSSAKSVTWLNDLRLPKKFIKTGTLFLIRENPCGIDGLRFGAIPGFAHIWLEEIGNWGLRGVHPVIGSFPTPIYPHITPPTWSEALSSSLPLNATQSNSLTHYESAEEPFVGIVKGPKRTGKSTFARSILNNLLEKYEKVAWLECDLGQGEFSPGGIVGLWILDKQVIGPSFTHPLIPYRAHYLGTFTPLTCPDEYISSIQHLIEIYKFDIQHQHASFSSSSEVDSSSKINDIIPLVINTQGWVKGLGEDLLRSIEQIAEPNHIYTFNSITSHNEFDTSYTRNGNSHSQGNGWTNSPPYNTNHLPDLYSTDNTSKRKEYKLESAPTTALQARFTAADFRVLSIISYFHCSISSPTSNDTEATAKSRTRWDFSKPILAINPWQVEYGVNKIINKVYLIGEGNEGILFDDLSIALNGSIVALVETDRSEPSGSEDQSGELYVQGRIPSLETNYLGLALIRSITCFSTSSTSSVLNGNDDMTQNPSGKIQLLTPISTETLKRCNGIIKNGSIEMPTPGLMDWTKPINEQDGIAGYNWDNVPFLDVSGIEVVGGERRRWRKNIMRKGM